MGTPQWSEGKGKTKNGVKVKRYVLEGTLPWDVAIVWEVTTTDDDDIDDDAIYVRRKRRRP